MTGQQVTSVGKPDHDDWIDVCLKRSSPESQSRFAVRRRRPTLVLDLLVAIQRECDSSLAFRYSCRVATCGTCTVQLDGVPVLACQTVVGDDVRSVRLGPVGGMPIVRDLIVDQAPFFGRWDRIGPFAGDEHPATGPAQVPPNAADRLAVDAALDCISCGACFSACSVAGPGRPFLGPAALNRAMTLVGDRRDRDDDRARIALGPSGVDGCHSIGACTAVCPKGLDPAGAIRRLRRWRVTGRTW